MNCYFTEDEMFNFKTSERRVSFLNKINYISEEAKRIYEIILAEMERRKYKNVQLLDGVPKFYIDKDGIYRKIRQGKYLYVELAQRTLMDKIGRSISTLGKRLDELVKAGLLDNVREGKYNGEKRYNKLFLKYPQNAERYEIKNIQDVNNYTKEQKNNVESDNPTLPKSDSNLISKANDIISQIKSFRLQENEVKELLALCDNNLDEFKLGILETVGKTPTKSYIQMLADILRKKYYKYNKSNDKTIASSSSKKESRITKPPNKNNKFLFGNTHNFDIEKIELMEILKLRLSIGEISEEEYNTEIQKIGYFKK